MCVFFAGEATMAMASRMSCGLQQCVLPGARRMSAALTLVLLMCIVSHNLMAPFTYVLAQEFEGFLEDVNDGEDLDAFVPPVARGHHSVGSNAGPNVAINLPKRKEDTRGRSADPLHEFWDEVEFEGFPVADEGLSSSTPAADGLQEKAGGEVKKNEIVTKPRTWQSYIFEAAGVLFFVIYGVVFWKGRKENENIALAWASQFAGNDSIFEKNFSLLGFGDEPDAPSLIKEGQSTFKFYASGRRYCKSLLATMVFQNRHDLLSQLIYLVSPAKDEITIEVNMNEDMEPLVFALVRKKKAKDALKDLKDLQQFATILNPPTTRKWVSEDLAVISESRELATDLLTEALLDQVFGEKAFQTYSPYFVSLHFSDQFPDVKQGQVLQFTFQIPPANKMAEMTRLIALVPHCIDLIGRYKLSSAAKTKASGVRSKIKADEFKEAAKQRLEAIQKKKAEQQVTLSGKREEKERLRQLKKSMPKVKMSRH